MTDTPTRVQEALAWLERRGSKRTRDEMRTRYGITAPRSFGVSVATIQQLAKRLGRDHGLAAALWATEWYEARMLAAFVDEPERVTPAQMDRWCRDFDNWGICDTVCFNLFDRTPHAWSKVAPWCGRREEFVRRAGFALLASLALHDKVAPETAFLRALPLVERGADRRSQLREEGRQLGAPEHRGAERSSARRRRRARRAPRDFRPPIGALAGQGCPPRSHRSGDAASTRETGERPPEEGLRHSSTPGPSGHRARRRTAVPPAPPRMRGRGSRNRPETTVRDGRP